MTYEYPTLRDRRRAETQRAIQAHALRLFSEQGYDATTVTDVAAAAGVSPMTVYRHFPTKEDLVLVDRYDRLIAGQIAASSASEPLVRRIGGALVAAARILTGEGTEGGLAGEAGVLLARLRLMIATPALRARHLDNTYALQQAIVDALGGDALKGEDAFRVAATASACLAVMHTALVQWAERDGRSDLADLIARGMAAAFGESMEEPRQEQ